MEDTAKREPRPYGPGKFEGGTDLDAAAWDALNEMGAWEAEDGNATDGPYWVGLALWVDELEGMDSWNLPAQHLTATNNEQGFVSIAWHETESAARDAYDTLAADLSPDIWAMMEDPPAEYANIVSLWSWSMNYDAGKGPASLFLDLIGWSQDELGENTYDLANASLGYRELEELRDAITDYLKDPHGALDYVRALLEAESRG